MKMKDADMQRMKVEKNLEEVVGKWKRKEDDLKKEMKENMNNTDIWKGKIWDKSLKKKKKRT